ncbi:hypothetical protein PINS_up011536 [Pythium insidiosum]|nr:hypothetical protein PINS_up011536 [Pythium insidiosum]
MDIFANLANLQGVGASWDVSAMLKTSGISVDVQRHLVQVYAALSACVLTAAITCGAVVLLSPTPLYMSKMSGWIGLISFLGATGGAVWLQMEPPHNFHKRFARAHDDLGGDGPQSLGACRADVGSRSNDSHHSVVRGTRTTRCIDFCT